MNNQDQLSKAAYHKHERWLNSSPEKLSNILPQSPGRWLSFARPGNSPPFSPKTQVVTPYTSRTLISFFWGWGVGGGGAGGRREGCITTLIFTMLLCSLHSACTSFAPLSSASAPSFIHWTFARPDLAVSGAGHRPTPRERWGARCLEQVQRIRL